MRVVVEISFGAAFRYGLSVRRKCQRLSSFSEKGSTCVLSKLSQLCVYIFLDILLSLIF
jgi:hypothetical protein